MEGGVSKSSQVSYRSGNDVPSFFVSRDESTAGGPHNNKAQHKVRLQDILS